MTFEEKFGFEISEEEAEKLKTVGNIVNYIIKRQEKKIVSSRHLYFLLPKNYNNDDLFCI